MSVTRKLFKDLAKSFVESTFADFTHEFTIQSLTRSSDGQGGLTTVWTDIATVRGFVEIKSGGEVIESTEKATRIDENEIFTFQFEYIDGINLTQRINYNGELYNIKMVKSLQNVDVFLIVDAERGSAQ